MNNLTAYLSTLEFDASNQEEFVKNLLDYLKNSSDITLFLLADTPEKFADFILIENDTIREMINNSSLYSYLKKTSTWYAPAADRSLCESFVSTISNRYTCAKQLFLEMYPDAKILRVSDDRMYINIVCERNGKQRSVDISNTDIYEKFFKPNEEQKEKDGYYLTC